MEQPTYNERRIYSLSEVAQSLKSVIEKNYTRDFYVKAEIAKLNFYPHSGHCYPDLVEKSQQRITAQMRSLIWASDFSRIRKKFVDITQNELNDGLEVLCLANMSYHPSYGFSLHIKDIIPEFSLGEMAKSKRETILRLQKEGLFDANKKKEVPLVPKHLAVISVSTSKGYEDFMNILQNASFPLHTYLFPALLQGDDAVPSILRQLEIIRKGVDYFDAVVIVRGGGGDIGLSCYDHYDLAEEIAQYPIPVVTGIGHSTNFTIAEMVAKQACITPTDTANFFLEKVYAFHQEILRCQNLITSWAGEKMRGERKTLLHYSQQLLRVSAYRMQNEKNKLSKAITSLKNASKFHLSHAQHQLERIDEKQRLLDPINVLQRGYSITLLNGKAVSSTEELKANDRIETQLLHGSIHSIVEPNPPSHGQENQRNA